MPMRKIVVPRPLRLRIRRQNGDTACGPASLRMMAEFLGRRFSEKELVKACSCDENGTDHDKLIQGARAIGAHVFAKADGDLEELRYFLHEARLPVMIGWWPGPRLSMAQIHADPEIDEGHFSVATHLTPDRIWIADPWYWEKDRAGLRRLALERFMQEPIGGDRMSYAWHDTDTPEYLPVDRWYLVINFDGRQFSDRFDGRDYAPTR
jgi:ABC-type bacteriocin/lantibiotic exporter with double-glycine peptidase domain